MVRLVRVVKLIRVDLFDLFQGANSTPELKTYPKIKIEGYKGPAVVVVSCVAHEGDKPRAHPHNLVSFECSPFSISTLISGEPSCSWQGGLQAGSVHDERALRAKSERGHDR